MNPQAYQDFSQPYSNPNQPAQNSNQNGDDMSKKPSPFDTKKIVSIVIGVVVGVILISAVIAIIIHFVRKNQNNNNPATTTSDISGTEDENTTPEKIDLQLAVDQWVNENSSDNVGIEIYDLDNNSVVARHNEDKAFRIESIYKMFVAYEGYYRIDHNIWNGEDVYPIANDYLGQPYTRAHCLDHMIRFSYSPCAEAMWNEIGQANLQQIYQDRGFTNTNISAITSTPSDLTKLYQIYWSHSDLSEDSWKTIQDSMLNQSIDSETLEKVTASGIDASAYTSNWRKGLPSGFAVATVYDKVGWLGDGTADPDGYLYFDDAAFAVFPKNKNKDTNATVPARHYIIIALTTNTKSSKLVELGRKIENAVRTADNY